MIVNQRVLILGGCVCLNPLISRNPILPELFEGLHNLVVCRHMHGCIGFRVCIPQAHMEDHEALNFHEGSIVDVGPGFRASLGEDTGFRV